MRGIRYYCIRIISQGTVAPCDMYRRFPLTNLENMKRQYFTVRKLLGILRNRQAYLGAGCYICWVRHTGLVYVLSIFAVCILSGILWESEI